LPCKISLEVPSLVSEKEHVQAEEACENSENQYFECLTEKWLTCPKWGDAIKQNVQNHPNTPDISFWTVAFLKHLRCNIIGAPNDQREFIT
jgi:hypothetical protein